ncbi:MAG: FkbM family methyltransferase [Candidatus Babeliales bacterium]|jgi:FkbM family methyltransferase
MKLLSFIRNIVLCLGTIFFLGLGFLFIFLDFGLSLQAFFLGFVLLVIFSGVIYFLTENYSKTAIRLRKAFYIIYLVFFICMAGLSFLGFKKGFGFNFFTSHVTQGVIKSISTENRHVVLSHVSNSLLLTNYCKIVVSALLNAKKNAYQMQLLDFKFSFPNYVDLLQLFRESFMSKDYYFVTDKADPFVIDCGGNIGMTVLFFKTLYPKAEILTFEPASTSLLFLNKNIHDNKLEDVIVINKAVSNKNGTCLFQDTPENTLAGHMQAQGNLRENRQTVVVDTILLSDYITKTVDFLKIDVEGAETLIFEDLDQSGKIKLIKEVVFECHSNTSLSAILAILQKNDFRYLIKKEEAPWWATTSLVHAFNKSHLSD